VSFLAELKRRNVFRVAAAYVIVGWLLLQVGEVLAPALHLPDWVNSALAFFIILGFPLAVIFAWAFEMTPEGLKLEKNVDRTQSITHRTGQKLNIAIIALLALALAYFAFDKFVLDPGRDAAKIEAAVQSAQEPVLPEQRTADKSIAVLPFVNMSSDEEQEYFSDGLSEELLNLLAKIPGLQVAARTSSFSFKGQNLEVPEIAARLGVAHVLEGSVRKAGSQVRITAQLIKADDGFHLWSETYDRTLDNIFQIQDEIAAHVVDALKVTLLGETPNVREADAEAYQLFLQGRYFALQRTPDSTVKAIDLFTRATELDPGYAPAWAELGQTLFWYSGMGNVSIDEGVGQALQATETALRLDPDLALGYYVRGAVRGYYDFDLAAARADWERAYELGPGNAFMVGVMGLSESLYGRFDEAGRYLKEAQRLDPVLPELYNALAYGAFSTGRLGEAEAAFRRVLEMSPEFSGGHARLGRLLLARGKPREALAEFEREANPIYGLMGLAMAYHDLGEPQRAQSSVQELIERGAEVAAYQIAQAYAYQAQLDDAFHWLERAHEIRDSGLPGLLGDPALYSLHGDPRWPEFLDKLGLRAAWLAMPPEWGGPPS